MRAELIVPLTTLHAFLLALARVSGVIVFVPIPGFSAGPDTSRVVLAVALTLALFPAWPAFPLEHGAFPGAGRLAEAIAFETVWGLTVGLIVSFLLEGVQLAAQTVGLQAGYSYASTVDPTTQADTTTLQMMAQLLAGLLFFALGFDRQVLRALAEGLESPAGFPLRGDPAAVEGVLRLGGNIFTSGLRLALPVIALLVLMDVAFALLGRLHAQLQLLSLSFSIKMLAALLFLSGILASYAGLFARSGAVTFAVLDRALHAATHAGTP
jgi:flagellar biosynthesis protein FliR